MAVIPIIVTEVLQGFRTARGFERARDVLTSLPTVHPAMDTHVAAARLYRSLRSRGVTIRGAVDCIIAVACLETRSTLLSPDRDFEKIAAHTRLRLWRP